MPDCLVLSIATCIAKRAGTWPSPPSPSTSAETGVSLMTRGRAAILARPSRRSRSYHGISMLPGYDAVQIGPAEDVGGGFGIVLRHAPSKQNGFELSAVFLIGGGHGGSSSGHSDTVHPCRGAAVECRLFHRRGTGGNTFESVPQLGVAARLLVGRKVALKHAAIWAKGLDAGLDVLTPRRGKFFG